MSTLSIASLFNFSHPLSVWSLFIGFNLHFPNDSSLITYNVDLEIEENTRLSEIYLCDFEVGKDVLKRSQKALNANLKIGELDLIKIQIFCS